MADPIIRVKRSTVAGKIPTVNQLGLGELAINHYDGKLFIRQDTLGVGIGTTVIQIGAQGIQGIQGTDGIQGSEGPQGIQGIQGIQGTDGIQGADGVQGADGPQGIQGVQGSSFSRTIDTLIASDSQTTFSTSYVVGYVDVFLNGARLSDTDYTATDGTSIVLNIGANEGDVVDVISFTSAGPQGIQGIQGIQGPQGVQGIQGIQGPQGVQGIQGIQGPQGVQGIQGIQGVQGPLTGVGINTEGGNVGYGATLLDFRGSGVSTAYFNSSVGIATIFIQGGGGGSLSISTSTTSDAQDIAFVGGASTDVIGIATVTDSFVFVPSSGRVGIGTTNPVVKLNVIGDVLVSGVMTCTDITTTSDIKLKENIQKVENAINIVSNLRGVRFEWKENHSPSFGVIAQELETILPELVTKTDPKTVNYNGIIGVLIEAVKEQQEQINTLKEEIKDLKK